MKRIALSLATVTALCLTACTESQPPKNEGQDQLQGPAQNAGPETEAARATKAVQDSTDNSVKKDTLTTGK